MTERLQSESPSTVDAIDRYLDLLLSSGARDDIWAVCLHTREFPRGLRRLNDTPPVIFGAGRFEQFIQLAGGESVAIVGARRASAYGRDVAYRLGHELSALDIAVVSGMALGIDGAAHRGALRGGGNTIAVLAGGPDAAYPRSHRLLHEELTKSGCVISENPPGTQAKRWAFAARNRIIAGIARLTVIVEGTMTSGARYTVDFAHQMNHEVGAVPGPVTSPLSAKPNDMLARQEALLVRGVDDVLDHFGFCGELRPVKTRDLNKTQSQIVDAIAAGDRDPTAIATHVPNLDSRELIRELGKLELAGEIQRIADGSYTARKNN
ncbi:MAG: DNA-processing protein DprA [Solirubrobacterales bacterium]